MSGLMSLAGFAAKLGTMAVEVTVAEKSALEKAAVIIEDEAKRVIGTYDYGWPPLAPSTLAHKSADTPLLETGEMRASIEHTVREKTAEVGSNDDKAVWHELGTATIPARSFLAGAAVHKGKEAAQEIGREVFAALIKG